MTVLVFAAIWWLNLHPSTLPTPLQRFTHRNHTANGYCNFFYCDTELPDKIQSCVFTLKRNSELSQWTHASRTHTRTRTRTHTRTPHSQNLRVKMKKACNNVQNTSQNWTSSPPPTRLIQKLQKCWNVHMFRFDIYPTNSTIQSFKYTQ